MTTMGIAMGAGFTNSKVSRRGGAGQALTLHACHMKSGQIESGLAQQPLLFCAQG